MILSAVDGASARVCGKKINRGRLEILWRLNMRLVKFLMNFGLKELINLGYYVKIL